MLFLGIIFGFLLDWLGFSTHFSGCSGTFWMSELEPLADFRKDSQHFFKRFLYDFLLCLLGSLYTLQGIFQDFSLLFFLLCFLTCSLDYSLGTWCRAIAALSFIYTLASHKLFKDLYLCLSLFSTCPFF